MRYRPLACSGSEGVPVWLWECSVWVLVRHRCLSFGALLSKCSLVCLFVHHRFFSACKDGKVVSPECFVRPQLEASNCAVGMYVFQFRLVLTESTSSPAQDGELGIQVSLSTHDHVEVAKSTSRVKIPVCCDLQGRKINSTTSNTVVGPVSRPTVALITLACVSFHYMFSCFFLLAFLCEHESAVDVRSGEGFHVNSS